MVKYNFNNYVTIYPTEHGWNRIIEITKNNYNLTWYAANELVDRRRVENNGFREQVWVIISDYNEIFYNGTTCLESMEFELYDDVIMDIKDIRKYKLKEINESTL